MCLITRVQGIDRFWYNIIGPVKVHCEAYRFYSPLLRLRLRGLEPLGSSLIAGTPAAPTDRRPETLRDWRTSRCLSGRWEKCPYLENSQEQILCYLCSVCKHQVTSSTLNEMCACFSRQDPQWGFDPSLQVYERATLPPCVRHQGQLLVHGGQERGTSQI